MKKKKKQKKERRKEKEELIALLWRASFLYFCTPCAYFYYVLFPCTYACAMSCIMSHR